MRIIYCLAILMLTQTLSAQQPASAVSTPYAVTGLIGTEFVGDMIFASAESKISFGQVGRIDVNPEATDVSVIAFDAQQNIVIAREIEPTVFIIEKPGSYVVFIDGQKVTPPRFFKLVIGGSTKPPPVDPPTPIPPVGDFAALAAKSKQLATALNDLPTVKLLTDGLDAVLARPPPTDVITARQSVSRAVEIALLARTGASRLKDWLNGWRLPIATELETLAAAGRFSTPAEYFRAIKALAESLK